MTYNLKQMWHDGLHHDREQHAELEAGKLGNLRAGDSGAMSKHGDVVGGCHRRAYVRTQLGIEVDPPTEDRLIMFEVGKANETIWMDKLKRVWKGVIKQEEEIPIAWSTTSGTRVTGRPDIVLCDEQGKPVLGIEHKAVCSVWTAREVTFELTPKMKHLVQSAHYAWQLRIPYRLVYTQYVDYAMPDFAKKFFPRDHESVALNDKGEVKSIKPHETIYEIDFDSQGQVVYRIEPPIGYKDSDYPFTSSVINIADVERYYEFIAKMGTNRALGPRPLPMKPTGKKAPYSDCDYCPLQEICDKYEHSWERWIENVKANR